MSKNSVVTIGVFDGVHSGHTAVIKRVVRRAKAKGLKSIVVTFDPHPLKVLKARPFVPSLISLKHRVNLIKELGIDEVIVMKFDRRMANLSPEEFVKDILVRRLGAGEIFVGSDFYFGRRASAGVKALKELAKKFSVNVKVVKPVKKAGSIVSSSLIRDLVSSGRIKEASRLLGRPFSILGTVVGGSRLARTLGYPTANINPHHEAMPPSGVYAVKVKFKEKAFKGVMNIGVRPTFYDHGRDKEPSIEVHIFGFNDRIYGKDLEIIFVKRMRSERKFKTIDSLVNQIRKDEISARKLLYK